MQTNFRVVNIDSALEKTSGYGWQEECVRSAGGELILRKAQTEDQVIEACSDADIVVVEYPHTPLSARVIGNLPRCTAILKCAVGFDNIDVTAASKHGIVVGHVPDYCTEEVSDHAVALLLVAVRRICSLDRNIRSGGWADIGGGPVMRRVSNLTLGLLGFGRIGRAVARKMSGFRMRMLAADPFMRSHEGEFGVQLVSLERLLRESDLISIHVRLTSETRSMLGDEQFKIMKASALLVNTSRGAVIDEEALIRAIEANRIAGAALDVTIQEPLPLLSPLRKFNNVVLTPHCAASSEDSMEQWRDSVADSIAALLNGRWPPFAVNPEITPRISRRPYASLAGVQMSKI